MSNISIELDKLRPGTENQKKVGIHATFNINLKANDGVVAVLYESKLCQSKAGDWYIQGPYRTYSGKDDSGNTVDKKASYYRLFPEEKNGPKMSALVAAARKELDAIENSGGSSNRKPAAAASNRAAPKASSDEPW